MRMVSVLATITAALLFVAGNASAQAPRVTVVASIDLAFGPDGSLYVLEYATAGLLSRDPTGRLVRLAPDGTRTTVCSAKVSSIQPASRSTLRARSTSRTSAFLAAAVRCSRSRHPLPRGGRGR